MFLAENLKINREKNALNTLKDSLGGTKKWVSEYCILALNYLDLIFFLILPKMLLQLTFQTS